MAEDKNDEKKESFGAEQSTQVSSAQKNENEKNRLTNVIKRINEESDKF